MRKVRNRVVKGRAILVNMLAIGLGAALLFTACAAPSPTEEKKVVRYAFIGGFTGPIATVAQPGLHAHRHHLDYFNEERGIPGVTVDFTWADTGYDLNRNISAFRRLREQGVVAVLTFDGLANHFYAKAAPRDQVPVHLLAITADMLYPAQEWIFSTAPSYAERFAVMADWIMENWKEERPPRVAFLMQDVPHVRAELGASKQYAERIGMEWIAPELIPSIPLDTSVQLLRLANQKVDFAYIGITEPPVMAILRDAERLGLMDEISFCVFDWAFADALADYLGPLVEGVFGAKTNPAVRELDNPGVQWTWEIWGRYHETEPRFTYLVSMNTAYVVPEAIRLAIAKVGYENLDGRTVKEAWETIEDLDPYGFGNPFTYTDPELRRGSRWVRVYQFQDQVLVRVTDWREAPSLQPMPWP